MQLWVAAFLHLGLGTCSSVLAWTPPKPPVADTAATRRDILMQGFNAAVATLLTASPASASLLDEYGTDPSKIQQKEATPTPTMASGRKDESVIEPNLRSNYYYPTNKKRYLPRIKRCSDAIPEAADSIGREDWEAVETFAVKIADDTILPMRLYTSSLTGGGTNVKVSYTKDMSKCADDFEKNQKKLLAALEKKDQEASSQALEGMAEALLTYRTVGRLLGPDGGGDIPSTDEIRRAACRVQGRTYSKAVQARDERLKGQAANESSS